MDSNELIGGPAKMCDESALVSLDEKPRRKRSSRWAGEDERMAIPGVPVALAAKMTNSQEKLYLIQLKIEEIGLKLRSGCFDLIVKKANRSPSPDPVYDDNGLRLNTRDLRMRQKLEADRQDLIRQAMELYPDYNPPADISLGSNSKLQEKVFIPQDVHPNINFIGMIIGPRGNSLRKLELETGCKIIIRGKGSTRDNKTRTEPLPGEDEPLHALVTANCEDNLLKGITQIQEIVADGLANPDGENELRRTQLRELAVLNGTVQASEISKCKNCGSSEHRHWECQVNANIVSVTVCERCGGGGHIASDCVFEGERAATAEERSKIDVAYSELMKELGVNNATPQKTTGDKNVPSILALPKSMVSQLPWSTSVGGSVSGSMSAAMPLVGPDQFLNNDIYSTEIKKVTQPQMNVTDNNSIDEVQQNAMAHLGLDLCGARHIIQVGPNQQPSIPPRRITTPRVQQPYYDQSQRPRTYMQNNYHQSGHPNQHNYNRVPQHANYMPGLLGPPQHGVMNRGPLMRQPFGAPGRDIFGRAPPPMPPKYKKQLLANPPTQNPGYLVQQNVMQPSNHVNDLLPWASNEPYGMPPGTQIPYNSIPPFQNYQMRYPGPPQQMHAQNMRPHMRNH